MPFHSCIKHENLSKNERATLKGSNYVFGPRLDAKGCKNREKENNSPNTNFDIFQEKTTI